MSKTILIRIESKYGRKLLYPANDTAQAFAAIAGQKTFATDTLEKIEGLGYKLQVQAETDWRT